MGLEPTRSIRTPGSKPGVSTIPPKRHATRRGTSTHGRCLLRVAISHSSPNFLLDALEGTRTPTAFRPQPPQGCMATKLHHQRGMFMLKLRIREAKFFRERGSVSDTLRRRSLLPRIRLSVLQVPAAGIEPTCTRPRVYNPLSLHVISLAWYIRSLIPGAIRRAT